MAKMNNPLGFVVKSDQILNEILIPKYYDPSIDAELDDLKNSHNVISIQSLLKENIISKNTGNEIGKMAYGTGDIPFIRTSDISNWELKMDAKQGVSEQIYNQYKDKQDVQAEDIMLVRDGTYLVGTTCLLSPHDTKILFQSHIMKFRVEDKIKLSPYLLLAALSCPIVIKQMKARQFTADIIDTLGNRIEEIELPFPNDTKISNEIIRRTKNIIKKRSGFKIKMENLISKLENTKFLSKDPFSEKSLGFVTKSDEIRNDILLPKYYDPSIEKTLESLKKTHELVTIGKFVKDKKITTATGDEIGKMAYGTGDIPFIRTSDIFNWEIKTDPKQGVSEQIYNQYKDKEDVQAEDIFVVRDGTYLVGSSCLLTNEDEKILYCGGLYKLRCKTKDKINPYLLFALLNTKIIKRQMKAMQFTRDVIDTLGKRLFELVIPIPKNKKLCANTQLKIKKLINEKKNLRLEQRIIRNKIQFLK